MILFPNERGKKRKYYHGQSVRFIQPVHSEYAPIDCQYNCETIKLVGVMKDEDVGLLRGRLCEYLMRLDKGIVLP